MVLSVHTQKITTNCGLLADFDRFLEIFSEIVVNYGAKSAYNKAYDK